MECVNCGKLGHTFRGCRAPVMSFGICAVKYVDSKPYYLLIRRRDSLSYVEFLRGKYNLNNPNYIQSLMNGMTVDERHRLVTKPFDILWYELWNGQNTRQYRSESTTAKVAFDTLRQSGDSNGKTLTSYVESTTTRWTEPEWGFPKGRRSLHETELHCALREFQEETGLAIDAVRVCHEEPLVEQYLGTNGIMYKQTYFLGVCSAEVTASVQTDNRIMQREVGGIGWFSYEDAYDHIRDTNREKRAMLELLHTRCSSSSAFISLGATTPRTSHG